MRRQRIDRIAALPEALAAAVAGLSEAQLDARSPEDIWNVRQVVHHLADSHMNAFIRTKLIVTEERPTLKPYDQDAWALLLDTQAMPCAASLDILRGLHLRWVKLFESLGEWDWSRVGLHPESGEVTIDSILRGYAQHGEDHLDQIVRIVAATSK